MLLDRWCAALREYSASYIASTGYRHKGAAAGQFVVAASEIHVTLSYQHRDKTKMRAHIRGGMHHAAKQVVDAVLWFYAGHRRKRPRRGASDHQGRLHRSPLRTVRT